MTEINQTAELNETVDTAAPVVKKSTKPKDWIKREDLTQEVLKEHLELREDGYFYWKKATVRSIVGDFAGSIRAHDLKYLVQFKGTIYTGEALIAFYHTGEFPAVQRGPRPSADGVVKEKAVATPRVPRVAPTITEEDRAAALKRFQDKRAAAALALAKRNQTAENKVEPTDVAAQIAAEAGAAIAEVETVAAE